MPRIEAAGRPMTGLGGSPYDGDGTWSVASTPYAGTAVPYAWQRGSSAPRLSRGPKLPSEWRCWRQWRDPGECCQRSAFRIGLRQAVEQFRLRKLAVI